MPNHIIVALGGNALIKPGQRGTLQEQIKNLDHAVEHIVKLVKRGHKIVITHGNGPQVGDILIQQARARAEVPAMPLHICVAESQGLIGYMIQDALYDKLHKHRIDMPVVTLITRVLVDPKDPAFRKPTKPIGPYHKLVPSPKPQRIIEAEAIKKIVDKAIVIACGGGGIPVIKRKRGYEGIEAVIDKDLASAKLAEILNANMLIILTDVDAVYLDYKKPRQKKLGRISLREIKKFYNQGHFPPGSMGPKIEAVINYLEHNKKGKAIITSFDKLELALAGKEGTIIEV